MFDYPADLRPYFASRNPTPKPTATEEDFHTSCSCPICKGIRRKAFEEAADRANRIAENDPSKAIRIAFLRFSAELRALAKE